MIDDNNNDVSKRMLIYVKSKISADYCGIAPLRKDDKSSLTQKKAEVLVCPIV